MKLHNFFEKLRDYPENTKKTIVFSLVGILGVMMLAFWFPYFLKRVDSLSKGLPDMVKLPSVITQSDNLQNQSDPTSQWVMYQNQDYGFSIKHPEDVILEETKDNETFNIQIKTRNISKKHEAFYFNLRIASFERHNAGRTFYIFILRENSKLDYLILPLHRKYETV